MTTSATAAEDAVIRHSDFRVDVTELTVELRPADEGISASMFVWLKRRIKGLIC